MPVETLEASPWIPVEKCKPEHDVRVLVVWESENWGPYVTFGRYYPQWDAWSIEFPISGNDHKISAWMPIPKIIQQEGR